MKQMTEDQFDEKFTIQKNHLTGNEAFGGMYETYDEELEYVFKLAKKEDRVWTIIEGDKGCADCTFEKETTKQSMLNEDYDCPHDCPISQTPTFYATGFHIVNRLGFIITNEVYTEEIEVKLED